MKFFKLVAATFALVLAATFGIAAVAPAQPAEAQTLWLGGKVYLSSASNGNMRVAGNLTSRNGLWVMLSPIGWIAPGQNSRAHAGIYDADAYQAPLGCSTYTMINGKKNYQTPGKVYKISDLTTITLTVRC